MICKSGLHEIKVFSNKNTIRKTPHYHSFLAETGTTIQFPSDIG